MESTETTDAPLDHVASVIDEVTARGAGSGWRLEQLISAVVLPAQIDTLMSQGVSRGDADLIAASTSLRWSPAKLYRVASDEVRARLRRAGSAHAREATINAGGSATLWLAGQILTNLLGEIGCAELRAEELEWVAPRWRTLLLWSLSNTVPRGETHESLEQQWEATADEELGATATAMIAVSLLWAEHLARGRQLIGSIECIDGLETLGAWLSRVRMLDLALDSDTATASFGISALQWLTREQTDPWS